MQFFNWLEKENINYREVTKKDFIEWRNYITDHNRERTVQNYILITKKLFKFMETSNYYKDITIGIMPPKRTKLYTDKKSLTIEQSKELLKSINRETPTGKRDYTIIFLLLSNGFRTIEVARIQLKHIHPKYIEIRGKGNIDYIKVSIRNEVFDAIQDYLLTRNSFNDDEYLFQSTSNFNKSKGIRSARIGKIVKDKLIAIGLNEPGYTAHSLRHTAVIIALKSGITLEKLMIFCRHQNIKTTQIYIETIHLEMEENNEASEAIINALLY